MTVVMTKTTEVEEVGNGQVLNVFKGWNGKNCWWIECVMWRKEKNQGHVLVWSLNTMWMVKSFTKVENTWERVVFMTKIKRSVSDISLTYFTTKCRHLNIWVWSHYPELAHLGNKQNREGKGSKNWTLRLSNNYRWEKGDSKGG